uniref:Uncharacterized protein n=1 Tax=viral metagenome TaxID=1070528 RepID=A0A6M3LM31_9ZZZZ
MAERKFDLDSYETVAARIPKAMKALEGYRMITHLMSPVDDLHRVVFKADLYNGDVLLATGWATEVEGDGYVNKTSHLENCESSAIGRALANYGYAGSDPAKRPSREEMAKVQRTEGQAEATVARVFADRMKTCPTCGEPKVMPSKYGKGWYCLACKGKFAEDHPGVVNGPQPEPTYGEAVGDVGLF